MFDTVCSLPLSSDLFAQAVHPTEPLVAVGLSAGHVATLKLPPLDGSIAAPTASRSQGRRGSNGTGVIETAWRTKRHKGSCRCLAYSIDGRQLYSAGTDGLVKAADSATGVVTGKVAVPFDPSASRQTVDAPTVIHALSPQTLLLSTDSGALHIYDLRDPAPSIPLDADHRKTAFTAARPSQTYQPHTDFISDLSPIPPSAASTSGFSKQWLTIGCTTLALTDLRRGVLAKSEDQEELLLSCLYVTGLPVKKSSGHSGSKAVVGGGDGVLTLWEKGQWDDQDERIHVSREGETLDCLAHVPDGVGGPGRRIAVGMGDGRIRFVRLGMNRVVGENSHDDVEGVAELGFDALGRMISGGGQVVKVWQEHMAGEAEDEREEEEGEGAAGKRTADSDDDDDDDQGDEDDDSDSDDEGPSHGRRKKRKRGKGPAPSKSNFNFSGLD